MNVKKVHTLGPEGTNCAMAAKVWLDQNKQDNCDIILYNTLENAVTELSDNTDVLMACIAYPKLHTLMFKNHPRLRLVDCIIVPTFEMVYALPKGADPALAKTIISHEAPLNLASPELRWIEANSNSDAACKCRNNVADICITTTAAAEKNNLKIVKSFGSIAMGFSIHQIA